MDVNGTLTYCGELLPDVAARLRRLAAGVRVVLASADTFGTLDSIAAKLALEACSAADAASKVALLGELGGDRCAMVGNGANDVQALETAGLGLRSSGGRMQAAPPSL